MSSFTQDIISYLTIKIPTDNEDSEEKRLVSILRWLETADAREVLPEEARLKRRKEVTDKFRRALIRKEMFRKCISFDRDELYN